METNKKIIVGVVAVVMIAMLGFMVNLLFFSSSTSEEKIAGSKMMISIPSVDENAIKDFTKKQNYDKEKLDKTKENPFTNLLNEAVAKNKNKPKTLAKPASETKKKKRTKKTKKKHKKTPQDEELKMILEMQKQIEAEQLRNEYAEQGKETSEDFSYNSATQNYGKNNTPLNSGFSSAGGTAKNGFYGVTNNSSKYERDLIPAEVVDQSVIIQGSTVAIRLKKRAYLEEQGIIIPKDAIVYGKAFFNGVDRLDIQIISYKSNDKLYNLKLNVFDFDGREGVHLGNRTWTKIPAKVANDVYNYAYQRGTQAGTLGGQNETIKLDEAKNVALLSATKEVSKEVFDKRRVLLPRKYNLWINIDARGGF